MTIFGYARVSTDGQTVAAQDAELLAAGAAKTYSEKISRTVRGRPELGKLLNRMPLPTNILGAMRRRTGVDGERLDGPGRPWGSETGAAVEGRVVGSPHRR